jgi:hypothetical protein
MISNSIRTGTLNARPRAPIHTIAKRMTLQEKKNVFVKQFMSFTHQIRITSCPIMSISLTVFTYIYRDDWWFLTPFYLYLIHMHSIQLITFIIWQGFLHLLPYVVVRQHSSQSKRLSLLVSYFCPENDTKKKIDHGHIIEHENKQFNWSKVVYIYKGILFPLSISKKINSGKSTNSFLPKQKLWSTKENGFCFQKLKCFTYLK